MLQLMTTTEIKDYNVLIDGRNVYDQNVNSSIVRFNELLKITTGRSEDYSTGCLLYYDYYLKDFNIVGMDLSHQAVIDSDPKLNQTICLQITKQKCCHDRLTVSEKKKKQS